jgi:hypothetical protein
MEGGQEFRIVSNIGGSAAGTQARRLPVWQIFVRHASGTDCIMAGDTHLTDGWGGIEILGSEQVRWAENNARIPVDGRAKSIVAVEIFLRWPINAGA